MKRVLIAYDSKSGTTKEVSELIKKGLEAKRVHAVVMNVEDVEHVAYDGVIVGSPVYSGDVLDSVKRFFSEHNTGLNEPVLGVFVVCMTDFYEHLPKLFLKKMRYELRKLPNAEAVFGGRLGGISRLDEDACTGFGEEFRRLL